MPNQEIALKVILEELEFLNHEYPEIIPKIFGSVDTVNGKKFVKKDYENLIDQLNKNSSGPSSFNFYPSDKDGACHKFCFGVATKKFGHSLEKNRTGFKGLIKEIIGYWLTCGNINQTTIIHTLDWDEEAFEKDWEGILNKYKSNGKEIKIYEIFEREGTSKLRYPIL
jgi:hypothetical protein